MFFDYIEGVPIRCFYIPVFSKSEKRDDLITYMYGKNRKFKIGDKLPINTMWYRYPKNLMILNLKDGKYMAHIIKDGVLWDNKYVGGVDKNIFNEIEAVINSDGDFININSYEDMELYIEDMNKYMDIVDNLESYNEYLVGKLNATYSSLRAVSSVTSIKSLILFIDYEDVCSINKFFNGKFRTNEMSLIEIKSFIFFNESIFAKIDLTIIKNILRKKYELAYIDLDIRFEEHFSFYEKQIIMNRDVLNKKWKNEVSFEEEKRFGELLECLRWAFEKREDSFVVEKIMDGYIYWCLKEINDLLEDNLDLVCNYKKWNDFSIINEFEIDIDMVLKLIEECKIKKIVS